MKQFLWTYALVDSARMLIRASQLFREQRDAIKNDAALSDEDKRQLRLVNAGVFTLIELLFVKLFQVSLRNVIRGMA